MGDRAYHEGRNFAKRREEDALKSEHLGMKREQVRIRQEQHQSPAMQWTPKT
jgi:hypothetical protein